MARLYLGVQRGPFEVKKLVAIKEMRQEITSDPHFFAMFVDEARIAARLSHPNVVHTYEVLDEAPNYYLVMEFLDGQSLLEVVRRVGRAHFPLHDHVWILTQLLAGLHYAHELSDFDGRPLQIVHRDVTPSNVFVCRSGETKLLDFGIANAKGSLAATHHGELKGKLGYLAPEQCLGQPAGVQSDLYSVGVMLWEAVARTRRVTGEIQVAQVQARIQGLEPPIEQVCPHAPATLVAILARALATKPEDRYASARAFQEDLEQFLVEEHSQAGPESVSRLLRAHFEQDRRELYRAVESYLGAWDRESSDPGLSVASVDRTPAPTREDATLELNEFEEVDEESRTSQIPVDHLLLEATKGDATPSRVPWWVRSYGSDAMQLWQSLRSPHTLQTWLWPLVVGLGAFVAIAVATVAIASRTAEPSSAELGVVRPRVQTDFAAATRAERVPEVVPTAIAPEPSAEPLPTVEPAAEASPVRTRPKPRASSHVSKRSQPAQATPPEIDPARIEPGMDFPAVAIQRNDQHRLDLENPYSQ